MKYLGYMPNDFVNGEGISVSVWTSGCPFHCKGCHNPESWDYNSGYKVPAALNLMIKRAILANGLHRNLSILGGEPMHPKNINGTTKLAKAFKEKYPEKNVWAWSGFKFDKDLKDKEVVKYLDVLVDGQYVDEQHNPKLEWRGSENQRVIDVQKSLEQNKVVMI